MLLALTATFSRKLSSGARRGTGHQPPTAQGFLFTAALAIAMSSLGSKERGVRQRDYVLGLSPRDQEQQWPGTCPQPHRFPGQDFGGHGIGCACPAVEESHKSW